CTHDRDIAGPSSTTRATTASLVDIALDVADDLPLVVAARVPHAVEAGVFTVRANLWEGTTLDIRATARRAPPHRNGAVIHRFTSSRNRHSSFPSSRSEEPRTT